MNPSRSILMLVSRIPPGPMLLLVLVGAAAITLLVLHQLDVQKKEFQEQLNIANRKPKIIVREIRNEVIPQVVPPDSKVRSGERAVTVAIDSANVTGGLIKPDCRVDIMVIVGSGIESRALPILSDVKVLDHNGSSVTFAVRAEDAPRLLKAASAGRLCLTVRSEADHAPVRTYEIAGQSSPGVKVVHAPPAPPIVIKPVEPAPKSTGPTIEQWSGNRKEVVSPSPN